jgi:hypothetical protein
VYQTTANTANINQSRADLLKDKPSVQKYFYSWQALVHRLRRPLRSVFDCLALGFWEQKPSPIAAVAKTIKPAFIHVKRLAFLEFAVAVVIALCLPNLIKASSLDD